MYNFSFYRVELDDESINEIEDKAESVPTLNVSSKDSPYALIDRFFPEREYNHEFMERNFQEKLKNGSFDNVNLGNLRPNEVWLSDGDLLVLKGGGTPNRKGFDAPWKPLDDYIGKFIFKCDQGIAIVTLYSYLSILLRLLAHVMVIRVVKFSSGGSK